MLIPKQIEELAADGQTIHRQIQLGELCAEDLIDACDELDVEPQHLLIQVGKNRALVLHRTDRRLGEALTDLKQQGQAAVGAGNLSGLSAAEIIGVCSQLGKHPSRLLIQATSDQGVVNLASI